jgi:hypothetical protein
VTGRYIRSVLFRGQGRRRSFQDTIQAESAPLKKGTIERRPIKMNGLTPSKDEFSACRPIDGLGSFVVDDLLRSNPEFISAANLQKQYRHGYNVPHVQHESVSRTRRRFNITKGIINWCYKQRVARVVMSGELRSTTTLFLHRRGFQQQSSSPMTDILRRIGEQ